MWPFLGSLITGGAGLLGSLFSSESNAQAATQNTQAQIAAQQQMLNQTEQYNAEQAQVNRDYQTQMSNTAYQRASADMEKAGLNPMMMFGSGGAASSPAGSSSSVGTPSVPLSNRQGALAGLSSLGDSVSKAVGSAVQMKQLDKMTDEIANLQVQRNLLDAETRLQRQKTSTEEQETAKRAAEANIAQTQIPGAQFSALQSRDLLSMPDWMRTAAVVGGWVGEKGSKTLSPVTDLVSSALKARGLLPRRSTSETTRDDGSSSFSERWSGMYR